MPKLKVLLLWIVGSGLLLLAVFTFQGKQNAFAAQPDSLLPKSASKNAEQKNRSNEEQKALQGSFVDEIQSLIDKWQGRALVGEGWLHVVEIHNRNKDQISVLPNGKEIPTDYISDTWYHLSDGGELIGLVAFMKDTNENIVQISTYINGLWRNVTLGEEWTGQADKVSLDYGFIQDIAKSDLYGSVVSREENEVDGNQAVVFSLTDVFDLPTKIEGYDIPIIEGSRRIAFDQQSGALLFVERILKDEQGKERLVERMEILLIEKVSSPPPSVLDYL